LKSSTIAKRYARAFFEIAKEDDKYETYYNELTLFSSILRDNQNLQDLFLNPVFDQHGKKAVVNSILEKINISQTTANFLKLLVDKQRIVVLPEIENAYRQLMDDVLKRTRVTVKTAFPLTPDLAGKLRDRFEEMTGKKIEMAISEDASLLGGVIVGVGDTLYDGSLKTQLHNIRNLLGEEI
jgi:F-type H+-transporting ATPase subunit delta